jgi:hypothetical protein
LLFNLMLQKLVVLVMVVVVGLWVWFLVWFVACISELLFHPETCSCPWNNNFI